METITHYLEDPNHFQDKEVQNRVASICRVALVQSRIHRRDRRAAEALPRAANTFFERSHHQCGYGKLTQSIGRAPSTSAVSNFLSGVGTMKDSLKSGLTFEFKFQVPKTRLSAPVSEAQELQEMPRSWPRDFSWDFVEWTCIQAINRT